MNKQEYDSMISVDRLLGIPDTVCANRSQILFQDEGVYEALERYKNPFVVDIYHDYEHKLENIPNSLYREDGDIIVIGNSKEDICMHILKLA